MSSAMPAALSLAISITTTSASSRSAIQRATADPTFPAPPTTVTLRFMSNTPIERNTGFGLWALGLHARKVSLSQIQARSLKPEACSPKLHVLDHRVPELGRLEFLRARHEAREVVGDLLGGNRAVHALHDQVGSFVPPEMAKHHLA